MFDSVFKLTKVNNNVDSSNRKRLWLQLINAEAQEEFNVLNQTGVPEIQKAVGYTVWNEFR